MKKTEFELINAIFDKAWDQEDDRVSRCSPPEQCEIIDEEGKVIGQSIVLRGDNGISYGKKGHRAAYLALAFDLKGRLVGTETVVPSTKQTFDF